MVQKDLAVCDGHVGAKNSLIAFNLGTYKSSMIVGRGKRLKLKCDYSPFTRPLDKSFKLIQFFWGHEYLWR